MRAAFFVGLMCSIAFAAYTPSDTSRPSPDGNWRVTWHCAGTWQRGSCSIALSRTSDGKVFFTRHSSDRYIAVAWSRDSHSCVLLDAPDNANTYLWLFRVQCREIATEKLDYDNVGNIIEAAVPAARPHTGALTRSGIEKIEWRSSSEFRLQMIYKNVPVTALVDVANPGSPKIHVVPHKET